MTWTTTRPITGLPHRPHCETAATSADPPWNGLAVADVTADVADDDTAGILLTESGGSTDVVEGGATDTYQVVLQSAPTADVSVSVVVIVGVVVEDLLAIDLLHLPGRDDGLHLVVEGD